MSLSLLIAAQLASNVTPAFDPRQLRTAVAGKPSEVLVLGSVHLSQLPKPLAREAVAPLLDRLARFRPEIITIEALSGEQCDQLKRFKPLHGEAYDSYCPDMAEVERSTRLSIPDATAEVARTLQDWPAQPTPAQRRNLAMLFLAADDTASALVQWLRLPESERHEGDGIDSALLARLQRASTNLNENYSIGASLAARMGLERVFPVDDHSADTPSPPGFEDAIIKVWSVKPVPPARDEYERRRSTLKDSTDLLSFYRWMNAPAIQRASVAYDMGAAARSKTAQPFGRQYLAWWETRNLRMVANIRSALASRPGARVLAIVGSTHKGYFDAYLDMMQDIRVVDATGYLK